MKKTILLAGTVMFLFTACNQAPEADKAATTEKQEAAVTADGVTFAADLTASNVDFTGTKPTGKHTGAFKLQSGEVTVKDGKLTAGNFVINIGSMVITDADTAGASKLKGHLLSPDFFDAAKYGTATFEISGVEVYDSVKIKSLLAGATHIISGNLKLKDSTKNISFPAKVSVAENSITAVADFNIDRSQWGLSYGNDKSLGDRFIRPEVNLKLNIAANRK
jgi:polyisoprenoid-binding protein YceI